MEKKSKKNKTYRVDVDQYLTTYRVDVDQYLAYGQRATASFFAMEKQKLAKGIVKYINYETRQQIIIQEESDE